MANRVLFEYISDTKGGGNILLGKNVSHFFKDDDFSWLHLDTINVDEVKENMGSYLVDNVAKMDVNEDLNLTFRSQACAWRVATEANGALIEDSALIVKTKPTRSWLELDRNSS